MNIGKQLRLNRIFDEDERAIIVAADHGLMLGPFVKGIIRFGETLKKLKAGKPDAILLSPGMLTRFGGILKGRSRPSLITRLDWTNMFRTADKSVLPPHRAMHNQIAEVEDAICLGADAVLVYFFLGYSEDEYESRDYDMVCKLARKCEHYGVPFFVEPMPSGPRVTGANYPDVVTLAVRMAIEAGADVLKVPYTHDKVTFKKVIEAAEGVPVLILGGARGKTDKDALDMMVEALEVGASGVVFGRNVLEAPDPVKMLAMLRAIVHDRLSVKQALKLSNNP